MKILFVNTFWGTGSTGKLTKSFLEYISAEGHEPYCIYAGGDVPNTSNGFKVKSFFSRKITILLERLTGLTGFFSPMATRRACAFIEKVSPDIIYLGNLHGYYINPYFLYQFIKKKRIPCVQIMWDEFAMTGKCTFSFDCEKYTDVCIGCPRLNDYPSSWFFDTSNKLFLHKKKAYDYDKLAFISVPFIISQAKRSALLKDGKLFPIDEAIDQEKLFYPRDVQALRERLGIPLNNKVILNVALYPSERKGGRYYLEAARLLEDREDITFVHVGFLGNNKECPRNYIPIGFVKDQVLLSEYYSLADLFVCTSFAETQPNTCLEALSCGTRICGFDISGIPTCADAPYGEYVEPRDSDALAHVIAKAPKKTEQSIMETRKYAESRFSSKDYNRRIFEVGLKLIEG